MLYLHFTLTTYQLMCQKLRIVHRIHNLQTYLHIIWGVRLPQNCLSQNSQKLKVFCLSWFWNLNFGILKVKFLLSFWYFWDMVWKDVYFFSLDHQFKLHLWESFHAKFEHKDKSFIAITKCEKRDYSPPSIFWRL